MQYRRTQVISSQFSEALRGITVDQKDRIYAAGDSQVKVFDAAGALLQQWATFKPAFSVAVAGDGAVYAGEAGQVEIFSGGGKLLNTWRDPERLGQVTAIGFFQTDVLVADSRDRCLRRYDRNGKFLNDIGKDNRMKGFLIPNGVLDFSVDSKGIIHAANPGKHRVERYTREGKLLGHIGRFDGIDPEGFTGCCNPTNVAVVGADRIYVTEKAGPRAKVLDFSGKLIAVIAADAFNEAAKNMDIAVDSRGRVFVAETVRREIMVFERAGNP